MALTLFITVEKITILPHDTTSETVKTVVKWFLDKNFLFNIDFTSLQFHEPSA